MDFGRGRIRAQRETIDGVKGQMSRINSPARYNLN
jgi:hypothetical protein